MRAVIWFALSLAACATPAPAPAPLTDTTPAPAITHREDGQGCTYQGVDYSAWQTFTIDGQLCGCAKGQVSCEPPSSGACFAGGQWIASGARGPWSDGCNSARCEDGRWSAITLLDCKIEILEVVYFDDASVQPLPQSEPILVALAQALVEHPEITLLAIEGHADAAEASPDGLAQARAQAVLAALVARGVPPERLVTVAYGPQRPVQPSPSERNRRVTFEVRGAK